MLAILDFITTILCVLLFSALYTVFGYYITDLFTDSPKWKPIEQVLFWIFWPIIIPMFLLACVAVVLTTIVIGIPVLFVIAYDYIKVFINKIIYR